MPAGPGASLSQARGHAEANAISDDGRVIGGRQGRLLHGPEAVIWIDRSPAYLKDFLRANGVRTPSRPGSDTGEITGVSPDGRVLVGYGAPLGLPRVHGDPRFKVAMP